MKEFRHASSRSPSLRDVVQAMAKLHRGRDNGEAVQQRGTNSRRPLLPGNGIRNGIGGNRLQQGKGQRSRYGHGTDPGRHAIRIARYRRLIGTERACLRTEHPVDMNTTCVVSCGRHDIAHVLHAQPAMALYAGSLACIPLVASAQADSAQPDREAHTLREIIVTADKTARSLEKVPASVATIDGDELEQSSITGMEQLEGRMPGLSFQPFGQAGMNAPVMRGITANFNTFSTSTLLLVDGVPVHTAQGFDDAMLDVDRIEVLRGPQSTLYGRNAESGVIAVHSLPMDGTPRTSAMVDLGSRNKRALRFSLSRPLMEDTLFASLSGSWMKQDGFIHNTSRGGKDDDREQRQIKLGLRWTPSAATDVVLRYANQNHDDGAALWGSPRQPRVQVGSTDSWNHSKGQSLSLDASHTLDAGIRLRAITAWSDIRDDVQQDTDFSAPDLLRIRRNHKLRSLSQEVRLEGKLGGTDWLAGLYLDHNDNQLNNGSRRMGVQDSVRVDQESRTTALFANWNVPLNARWRVSAGARLEHSRVEITPQGTDKRARNWNSLSPRLAVQNQYTAEHQWYASVSRGIRTGGFNTFSAVANFAPFEPEKSWSYETGLKGWANGKHLRYSAALYYMDISNMQVMQMPTPGIMYITSAATATSKGIELDAQYLLTSVWQLQGGIAWNRTRFDRFMDGASNYAGHQNPFAPDLGGYVGVRYGDAMGWYAQAQVRGTSKVYLDAANIYRRNGYGLINLATGYRGNGWEVTAYANNAANRVHDAVGYQNGYVTVFSQPRELGVRVIWRM